MKNIIARFIREEEGQDLIEYALLGTFVALAAYVGLGTIGTALRGWYETMGTAVQEACTEATTDFPGADCGSSD